MRALILVVLMLSACASPVPPAPTTPPPASAPTPRDLSPFARQVSDDLGRSAVALSAPEIVAAGFGQTADLGGGLTVRPLAIVEDSRCPGNTACLWEGRLIIRATVAGRDRELRLGESLGTPAGTVVFVAVSPGAWSDWPTNELGPRPPFRFGFRRG